MTTNLLSKYQNSFYSNNSWIIAQNACQKFDPADVSISRDWHQMGNHYQLFSNLIKTKGRPITNQKESGRCWIFACLNAIRIPFMKRFKIKEFEFSQSHIFFWDKIERSNYFLNAIVLTAKRGDCLDSRLVMSLLHTPIEDGGHWNMVANIIQKYGLMPRINFPESYNSTKSDFMNDILNSKLREYAVVLRNMVINSATDDVIQSEINKYMCIVYRIVGICLGIPKERFEWSYYDCDHKLQLFNQITPLEFYETFVKPVFDVSTKVCLVSDPRPGHLFGHLYEVNMSNNMVEGSQVVFNNQPIEVLLQACCDSIMKRNEPVWFGCQVYRMPQIYQT
ncbi:bleomycin hydrolase-like [Daktulosphaira vitifoliae]|uniref:bleomycin hydrolase-like n=1 Tax=Daktulosphaira vitifoliae TaxID=58002 RepID=UPI0021AAEB0F|nr:bleomycin hydrolase-like [Daktulosphaira vitifoliae]